MVRQIRIFLDEEEYEELLKKKEGKLTWKDLLLKSIEKQEAKDNNEKKDN